MFRAADLVLLNKTDLLPYVDFDVDAFLDGARRANPGMEVLPLSATTGDGIDGWYGWLRARLPDHVAAGYVRLGIRAHSAR
jgi:hydrogenase nickel incorporation protein HypB